MKIEKSNKKDQIWLIIFIIIPSIILMRLNEYIGEGAMQKILFSGLFGGLGAVIGVFVFQIVSKKSTLIKVGGIICLIGISILLFGGMVKLSQPTYLTCEICGYKSIDNKKQECEVCGNVTWHIVLEEHDRSYPSKQKWISEEQLIWFGQEDSADFFLPIYKDNFEKDKAWKPSITKEQLDSDTL